MNFEPKSPLADRWERMKFKNNKVWVAVDADGRPVIADGRARVRYRREDEEREYRVNPANLHSLDDPTPQPTPSGSRQKAAAVENHIPENAVVIYTDGASSGNPGPSGIGVVLRWGEHQREISRHIGKATNNIAELEAIRAALEAVKNPKLPVRIYTDSGYAYGLLTLGWKAKKNIQQVNEIRSLLAAFADIKILKVKGHAGDPGNERADHLATTAIRKGGA